MAAANSNEPNRQAKHTIEDSRAYFPPVLMYHDVKAVPLNYFDVSVEDFCAQLDWLKKAGYQTLSMEEFTAIVQKGQPFPKKSVVITFDDGYKGIYDYAAPELKKRGMKATFFIIPDLVGVPDDTYPYITKEELKELSSSNLFSIGSHTMSHPHLDQLEAEEKQKEICQSKKVLEEWTGRPVTSLAFPFGAYDKSVIKEVKAAGYQVSFAVQDRGLLHEKARYSIPRIYVGLEMGKDNLSLFQHYVKHYKDMPAAAFVERWEFFEE
ncbi:polysaccharide deacetylase family protein [Selenomonas sp.]|uniref:polysaccharide deacetylase family protein n=1 Tax=Selenomonas sp. TaxID=2053611 RepID=UPI0025D214B1|nr:polysaccharide deacetylase family protein [Selenomonas sp.]